MIDYCMVTNMFLAPTNHFGDRYSDHDTILHYTRLTMSTRCCKNREKNDALHSHCIKILWKSMSKFGIDHIHFDSAGSDGVILSL